ncbi:aa3-type cytochrome c oxidase subunit IV [Polymorphobacter sp. PAMC 29334]|nr:aa3-type cytochrome c oxidase subunit IV [Polymorphobacter sp. PAMC 29334]QYE36150.1 aa3-type cytochrome c oxidase subunit IV [Polymorphobacter sp. PAMC 29334]
MADDLNAAVPQANVPNTRFYGSFVDVLKWAVVALALLLIAMALFLVH